MTARFWWTGLLSLLALLPAAALAAPAEAPVMPDWMTGCWIEEGAQWTEECWMRPRGGNMLGASRSGTGDKVTDTEMMRIDTAVPMGDGSVAPMALRFAQQDGSWTGFAWSPSAAPGVTFVNPAHAYPQRIRYWREGAALIAELSALDGSNAKRWTYAAAKK